MAAQLCPHCGTPNRAGSNFCNRCGADLRSESAGGAHAEPIEGASPTPVDSPSSNAAKLPHHALPAADQPWLEPGFVGADDVPFEDEDDELAAFDELPPLPVPASRLVSGVQGLLDPIRVAAMPHERTDPSAVLPGGTPGAEAPFSIEQLRRVRALLADEPVLASGRAHRPAQQQSLWLPWIFLIVGLGVAIPLFLGWPLPPGTPALWSGVDRGYAAIERLGRGARVQLLWAYDPATAGEMDLLSVPVLRHLLSRGATLQVISLLPNGPATARRIFADIEQQRLPELTAVGVHREVEVRFLPGGETVLPLLATEQAELAVLFAAQAEDVQQWVEQVAPVNRAPVLAVTAAGADPPLRPYLDSGQLVGLVSGFDGAYHYAELLDDPRVPGDVLAMRAQIAGQGYGALAIVAIITIGNLIAVLAGRRQND